MSALFFQDLLRELECLAWTALPVSSDGDPVDDDEFDDE